MLNRGLLKVCPLALLLLGSSLPAQQLRLTLDVGKAVTPVSPTLYGLMIEEINHSIDGGLYAEMVQNRAFHYDWSGTTPWDLVRRGSSQGTRELDLTSGPAQELSSSMKLSITSASPENEAGLKNPGYWGFGLKADTTYTGSLYAHIEKDSPGPITIRLINNRTGTVQASSTVIPKPGTWAQYRYTLKTAKIAPSTNNHLEITVAHPAPFGFNSSASFSPLITTVQMAYAPTLWE